MRRRLYLLLLPCILACGESDPARGSWSQEKREDYALPVRVVTPARGAVADYVETQATLETDRWADIYAEVDGQIVSKVCDVGDRVGVAPDGDDPMLLARIDDRDLALALKDAEIQLKEKKGRIRELELERKRAARELEQARVSVQEAEAVRKRTGEGIKDGTISIEENERATFALSIAQEKVLAAEAARDQTDVALELGAVAIEKVKVALDRAAVILERATLRAPLAGVVTLCNVREGERVRTGDLLFRIEDPLSLIVYGDLPVRQAMRVKVGDPVHLSSTAVEGGTTGRVVLLSPVVDRESGTLRVKVKVEPAPGFKPGLFVTLRIVVATRADALVVPKRAILHDDEEGTYVFAVEDGKAVRLLVETGFSGDGVIEVRKGLTAGAQVIVEGQDTASDGASVEIRPDPPRTPEPDEPR